MTTSMAFPGYPAGLAYRRSLHRIFEKASEMDAQRDEETFYRGIPYLNLLHSIVNVKIG